MRVQRNVDEIVLGLSVCVRVAGPGWGACAIDIIERRSRIADVDKRHVSQRLESPGTGRDDAMRHVFLAAGEAAILEVAGPVTLIAVVRALRAARRRRNVSGLAVGVRKRPLEVVEERLLQLPGEAVGVIAVDIGDVDHLLAATDERGGSTVGVQRSVENTSIAISAL